MELSSAGRTQGALGRLRHAGRPASCGDRELTSATRRAYKPPARFISRPHFSRLASRLEMAARRGPGSPVVRDCSSLVAGRLWSERREADLSTEQARSQATPWVSRTHGDSRRSQGAERSPRARPQALVGLAIRAGSARPSPRPRGPNALDYTAGQGAADGPKYGRLTRRAEFQRTARGRRAQLEAFALLANRRAEPAASSGPASASP